MLIEITLFIWRYYRQIDLMSILVYWCICEKTKFLEFILDNRFWYSPLIILYLLTLVSIFSYTFEISLKHASIVGWKIFIHKYVIKTYKMAILNKISTEISFIPYMCNNRLRNLFFGGCVRVFVHKRQVHLHHYVFHAVRFVRLK